MATFNRSRNGKVFSRDIKLDLFIPCYRGTFTFPNWPAEEQLHLGAVRSRIST